MQGHGARSQGRRARRRPGSPWKQGLTTQAVPPGCGAGASHRTVQAWMDSSGKNSQGRDPRTQERQEHSQLQANKEQSPFKTAKDGTPEPKNEKSGPTAGRKRATTAGKSGPTSIANCRRTAGSQPSVKQTGNNHQSDRDPQTQITQQDGRDARQSSTEALTFQTVLKDRNLSSHRGNHRDPCLSAEADWIQKIVEIPPLQCNDEKVEQWSSVFRRLRTCCRLKPVGNGLMTL